MYPILFSIGPVSFHSYGVIVSIGFFVAALFLIRLTEKASLNLQFVADHFFPFLILSFIGARISYVLLYWEEFSFDLWRILYIWEGGFLLWGGIISFLLVFYYYSKRNKEDFSLWLSVFITPSILWSFFESIGAFLDGRDFGTQTTLPWGVQFDNPAVPFAGVSVHPTQLYCAFFFILFFLWLKMKWRNKSNVLKMFGYAGIFIYSVFMFLIDFFHGDFIPYFFGLRATQVISLLVAIFFLIHYLLKRSSVKTI